MSDQENQGIFNSDANNLNTNTPNNLYLSNEQTNNYNPSYRPDINNSFYSSSYQSSHNNNNNGYSPNNNQNNNQSNDNFCDNQQVPLNNWPDNYQNNYPDNSPNNNYDNNIENNINSNKDTTDAKTPNSDVKTNINNAPKHSIKYVPIKKYKPSIRPNIDSNSSAEDQKIFEFESLLDTEYSENKTILLDITDYSKSGTENGFIKFDKSVQIDFSFSKSYYSKIMHRTNSGKLPKAEASDSILNKSLSCENYKKSIDLDMKLRLNQLNQIYLAHLYKNKPSLLSPKYLAKQISVYNGHNCISLAYLHGFSMTDEKGEVVPTVLTQRPVNGPLSSLFETVKMNQSKKGQISGTDSFNIKSINEEQKFALICGITRALIFIHNKGFIHSNLNPTTVYLDENLFPVVCDYIFIPPYEAVELKIEKNEEDEYEEEDEDKGEANERVNHLFDFKFDKKLNPELFQNSLYVAPEMKNGGMNVESTADVYSLGLVMYFILAENEASFDGKNISVEGIDEKWKKLISKCISSDPSERPTASEILDELLGNRRMLHFISSINPSSGPLKISNVIDLYLILLKKGKSVAFPIFQPMIPNYNELDFETRLTIMAAEKGDVPHISKVGDFFRLGQNNLHQNETFSYSCYNKASQLGDAYSTVMMAEFNEKGCGMEVNLSKAIIFYKKALVQMPKEDSIRLDIKKKIISLLELSSTINIVNIPLNVTQQNIKRLFSNAVDVEPIPLKEGETLQQMKIKFEDNSKLNDFENDFKKNPSLYSIDNKPIEFRYPYQKNTNEFHQLKSLLTSKYINLDEYYPIPNRNKHSSKKYNELGRGSFANVYLVGKKGTDELFVAKIFKGVDIEVLNLLQREILMPSNLNHPCILKYIGYHQHSLINYFENKNRNAFLPTLLMEYVPNGSLEYAINNRIVKFDGTARLKVIIGIASALNEMCANNIIHRDLKPENIFLNENYEAVIGDLGLARQFTNLMNNRNTNNRGSPLYMAPELQVNDPLYYKNEVDVYSFGVILFQIVTLTKSSDLYSEYRKPFSAFCKAKLSNRYVFELVNKFQMNQTFKNLILMCWNVEKHQRPDPLTIYETLIDTVYESTEPLLPGANMEAVKKYIESLRALETL